MFEKRQLRIHIGQLVLEGKLKKELDFAYLGLKLYLVNCLRITVNCQLPGETLMSTAK